MAQARAGRFQDKVAIVTGGAYGIGRAFCLGLAGVGAKVVVADIVPEGAQETVRSIQDAGGEAMALRTDVSLPEDTLEMAEKTAERFGAIDILINNAAMAQRSGIHGTPFHEYDMSVWDRVIAVNLTGTLLCVRAVFPYMKERGGKIINISSSTFFSGASGLSHYVASKGGVIGLTRALAQELGQYKINVNSIAPGATFTEDPDNLEALARQERIAAPRSIQRVEFAEDLVGAAIFLASADSDFITGQTLVVDGGDLKH